MVPGPLRRLLRPAPAAAPPDPRCPELQDAPVEAPTARTPGVCEECVALGSTWVHLRQCLTCGHVGCCDSGEHRHARAHAAQADHPVMRSAEPGEDWRWCYVHEQLG